MLLATMMGINYRHPAGTAVNTSLEERRVNAIGSGHPGGANATLADGSVRLLSQSIATATLHAAGTRAGGEAAGLDE